MKYFEFTIIRIGVCGVCVCVSVCVFACVNMCVWKGNSQGFCMYLCPFGNLEFGSKGSGHELNLSVVVTPSLPTVNSEVMSISLIFCGLLDYSACL